MEIQQLRYLIAAAETSSFARAAKECFTSRQNVAHSIKSIEKELDVVVFKRQGNEMIVTPAGLQVIQKARNIVNEVDSMKSMFTEIDDLDAPLNIALGVNLMAGISSDAGRYFVDHASTLHLSEKSPDRCYHSVLDGEEDLAFVMCMNRSYPGVKVVEFSRSRAYALMRAAGNVPDAIDVDELKGRQLPLMSTPPFQYAPLFARLDAIGCNRERVCAIPSTSTMIRMVKQGGSVGIVSQRFAANPPRGTVAVPFLDSRVDWRFCALYSQDSERLDHIQRVIQDLRGASIRTA